MSIVVEKDVPIPTKRTFHKTSVYPYSSMDVGDSFLVEFDDENVNRDRLIRRVRQSTMWAKRRYAPSRFSARVVDGGVRVWRVA